MSTLKATNIKNESSASNNIVLDSGGGVVVSGILTATTFSGDVSGNITIGAGSTSAPSLAPSGDSNTGIFFPSADTIAFAEGGAEAARFDSSGRLLVGTNSARSNFYNSTVDVGLLLEGTGTTARAALVRSSADTSGAGLVIGKQRSGAVGGNTIVSAGDEIGRISYQGNDGTEFVESAYIAAYVDTTPGANDMPGRLVFSTTADGASSPTARMDLKNDGGVRLFPNSSQSVNLSSAKAAGTTDLFFVGKYGATGFDSGANGIIVYTNGNVVNANNSYGAISDIKLKENIVDASSQWDDIKALRPVNYNFKEGQNHTQLGLIAQEVELVSPGLVSESPDRDEEGNDLGTVTKSVNYSVLYMKAVKALQEAQERIETLEAQNAAILARLDAAGL